MRGIYLTAAALLLTGCGGTEAAEPSAQPVATVTATETVTAPPIIDRADSASEMAYVATVRSGADEWDESLDRDILDLGYMMCDDGREITDRTTLTAYFERYEPSIPADDVIVAMSSASTTLCPAELAHLDALMQ